MEANKHMQGKDRMEADEFNAQACKEQNQDEEAEEFVYDGVFPHIDKAKERANLFTSKVQCSTIVVKVSNKTCSA